MTHCKVFDVSQRLNSENVLVNPPNEEEKKEISKNSHRNLIYSSNWNNQRNRQSIWNIGFQDAGC